jgi:hypothetical protein
MLFYHTSKALVVTFDAEQQDNWNQSIQPSSIHSSIQTGAFVGAAGSLVANSITITYGMPDEVEQDDGKVLYNTYKMVSS